MKIEVKKLKKNFKQITILDDVSATFESGHIYGLYGRNGSGKTVFLKLLCGLYIPTSGNVSIDGVDINRSNTNPLDMRVLIERPSFFPDLTGFKNLKLLADIQKKIGEKEILNALEIVNLSTEKDKKFAKYSLGMKQKLGIAQAIMENPSVLLLDEPFNGIERASVEKIMSYLKQKREEGKIIIISTHLKEDLKELADTIFEFDGGKIKKVAKNEF